MNTKLLKRIEINSKVLLGKPVIRGTGISVEIILRKLADNISIEDIPADYPRLTKDDIRAAMVYAAETISTEQVFPLTAI
jgi:uncharacterized protein (DUF433 family)